MLIYMVYGFLITLIVYYLYDRPFDSFEINQMAGSKFIENIINNKKKMMDLMDLIKDMLEI